MSDMWKGISEALVNSIEHAYRGDRNDGCGRYTERRWWMFSQERNGALTVAVCDLGIGIRRSLPIAWDRPLIAQLFKVMNRKDLDLASIQLALKIGETSTGQENRGRGLPQIWNGMRSVNVGGIAIMSGKGHLTYEASEGKESASEFSDSILGTLIMWTLPVDAQLGHG